MLISASRRTDIPAFYSAWLMNRLREGFCITPNPFNPRTELRFALAQPGRVVLAVHDLTGRRVAVLADRELAAGPHTFPWQGRDTAGRTVASGVYVARLVTAEGTTTTRLTLLR